MYIDSKFKCCVRNIFYFNCNLYFKGRAKEIFALSILPLFFPCSYLKCKRAGTNRWRPSKIEMRKGFLLHVKVFFCILFVYFSDKNVLLFS